MNCALPPALTEAQLLAHLAGEEDEQVAAHLAHCGYCRARMQRLAGLEQGLAVALFRAACPNPEQLGEFHLGLLAAAPTREVATHLADCFRCQAEIDQLRAFLGELRHEVEASPPTRLRVLIARLLPQGAGGVWPLAPTPAFGALRGSEEGPTLYQVEGVQVAIEIEPDIEQPDRHCLLGLVTGIAPQGLEAALWRAGQRVARVAVDEFGNFSFEHLLPGHYDLILSGVTVEIHIQALPVPR